MDTVPRSKRSVLDWTLRGFFLLLLVLVPLFFSLDLTTYTLPKVVLCQVLACLALGAWFIKMSLDGRILFKPSMLSYPILIYWIISVFSLFQAMSLPGGVSLLWQVFSYIVFYFIVINCFEEEEIGTWVLILTLVGFLMSLYGLLQYFGVEPILKNYSFVARTPVATLGHRNQVAQYLVLLIPLSGVFFFLTRSWVKRVVFAVSTVVMGYLLYLTKSRGGILGLLVALLVFLGVVIYQEASRLPLIRRKRWLLPLCFFLLTAVPVLYFVLPAPLTLKGGTSNPFGYYISSVDGSKMRTPGGIRIELDYRILRGDPQKPGYVGLYGRQNASDPVFLPQEGKGWTHLRKDDLRFRVTLLDEDIKLRWVPGSDDSAVQFKNVTVETSEGTRLIKSGSLDPYFSRLGVTEIDKAVSTRARLHMYRNTVNMVKDNFLVGVGFGNFKYVYPRYRDREEWSLSGLNTRVEQAHNEYLQIFSEVGVIGFLAFLWILGAIGSMGWEVIRGRALSPRGIMGLALMTGIIGALVQSFFDFNLQNPASGVAFWVMVGFLELVYRSEVKPLGRPDPAPFRFASSSKKLRMAMATGILIGLTAGIYYSLRPAIGDYYMKQGRIFGEMKDLESALYSFEKASHYSPYNFDIQFHLGQTCDLAKNYERAVGYYKRALSLHPYFIEARNNLGAVFIRLGMIDEAIEEFKEAIELNPFYPGLHNNLGYLYGKRNQFRQALDEYQKTLELDPENPEVHKNLGLLYYYKIRDYPKAKQYWEKYLALNPTDPQNASIRKKIEEMNKGIRPSF
jgi:O-antigen ligase/Tfp pilus assembly protein PilF